MSTWEKLYRPRNKGHIHPSLVQPLITHRAPGEIWRLSWIALRDGESYRCVNESQAFLANDCPSVSSACSISSPFAKWLCQREWLGRIGLTLSLITCRNESHPKSYWTWRHGWIKLVNIAGPVWSWPSGPPSRIENTRRWRGFYVYPARSHHAAYFNAHWFIAFGEGDTRRFTRRCSPPEDASQNRPPQGSRGHTASSSSWER